MKRLMILISLIPLAGCTDEQPRGRQLGNPLLVPQAQADDEGTVVVGCFDLSGSFRDQMTRDGKAWDFMCRVIEKYARASVGNDNEVIIAQLSNTNKPLLYQGSVRQLHDDFDDADSFRIYLKAKSDPAGSRLHAGIADVIDYVLLQPGVATGKKRVVLVVVSDMSDTTSDQIQSKMRLLRSMKTFARVQPAVGFYWVDQTLVAEWKRNLTEAGLQNFVVEGDVRWNPTLPQF